MKKMKKNSLGVVFLLFLRCFASVVSIYGRERREEKRRRKEKKKKKKMRCVCGVCDV